MNERQRKIRQIIREAKEFASDYGIVKNDLMTRVSPNKSTSYWAVYASPKGEIKPTLGKISGNEVYSHWTWAKMRERELIEEGLETYLKKFPAYGNESCQITYPVLNSDSIYASYLVFHESFHIQSRKKRFGLRGTPLEENFADGFALHLQRDFFRGQPKTLIELENWYNEWGEYYSLAEIYYNWMKETLSNSPQQKNRTHKRIIEDARQKAKKFKSNGIKKVLSNGSFNNAHLLQTSFYFNQPGDIEEMLSRINPHEYIHSRQDLHDTLRKLGISL
jgi:hypothetical protein